MRQPFNILFQWLTLLIGYEIIVSNFIGIIFIVLRMAGADIELNYKNNIIEFILVFMSSQITIAPLLGPLFIYSFVTTLIYKYKIMPNRDLTNAELKTVKYHWIFIWGFLLYVLCWIVIYVLLRYYILPMPNR